MKKGKIKALFLCSLMLCSVFFGGCKKAEETKNISTNDEAAVSATVSVTDTSAFQTETTVSQPQSETSEPATEAQKETSAEESEDTNKKQNESPKPQNGSSNTSSSAASSNISSSAGSSNTSSSAGSASSSKMTCTVSVNNKDYTAKKGDIITYTYKLTTPKNVECLQAKVTYTPATLRLLEEDAKEMFPVLRESAFYNCQNPGVIHYNASELKGFDFKDGAALLTLKFEVIYGGSGAITNAIEFMDEKGGKPYVDNYKFNENVKHSEALKIN